MQISTGGVVISQEIITKEYFLSGEYLSTAKPGDLEKSIEYERLPAAPEDLIGRHSRNLFIKENKKLRKSVAHRSKNKNLITTYYRFFMFICYS